MLCWDRAIVVEVVRRADDLAAELAVGGERWARQLAALEALQLFAPMGHALGLQGLSSQLEDRCFQVGCGAPACSDACTATSPPSHAASVPGNIASLPLAA